MNSTPEDPPVSQPYWNAGVRRLAALAALAALATAAAAAEPRYTAEGDLLAPADYREWVFLSAGLDMSYFPGASGHSTFDNVFVEPEAWRAFKASGHWPDGTILAKEARSATGKGSINRRGRFQSGAALDVEFHVRDSRRFPGGWAFFILGADGRAAHVAETADCYTCHREHGALDTTFVQFYPTARPIAERAGSYRGD
ncbi:MAG: cytochrome P460 family protein [Proteobacteria bacterium]|nr:cytochrome P460 family protein [Pseudomonadota bacterium]